MTHVRFVRQSFYQLIRAIPALMMILVVLNVIGLGKYALAAGANHALNVVVKFNLLMKKIKSILFIIKDNTPIAKVWRYLGDGQSVGKIKGFLVSVSDKKYMRF